MQKTGRGSLCGSMLQSHERGAAGFSCSGNGGAGKCGHGWERVNAGYMAEEPSTENWWRRSFCCLPSGSFCTSQQLILRLATCVYSGSSTAVWEVAVWAFVLGWG